MPHRHPGNHPDNHPGCVGRVRQFSPSLVVVGTDLVQVDEIARSLEQFGKRYLQRVFTADEIAYCMKEPHWAIMRLAARFAAKEATFKVLRLGNVALPWTNVAVSHTESGACVLNLSGFVLEAAEAAGFIAFSVSLTHERDYAAAVVLGQRQDFQSVAPFVGATA